MKLSIYFLLAFFVALIAWAQEGMTPARFRQLVATSGDTNTLRPQLASLPFWTNSMCHVAMKYQDGRTFNEDCAQSAKTIDGKYIVFSMDSKFYKQTMYSIGEFDEKASAIKLWGLYGDTLTQATINFDANKKISAATSSYADFMEISVGNSSANEMSEHTLVYKGGILFMTRDVKTWPRTTTNSQKQ